ncbi:MAG TPA: hypothetical protein K8V51_00710 [Campylobacter avium]|uniref:hypothetical protein n=1 Tax=Campylobacter avium TaxID=522485 RepID=UPI001DE4610F|nr:hypothetical protein [Campylobacter avium]HJE65568.1 hypothetical protein [Campylobacter avium]
MIAYCLHYILEQSFVDDKGIDIIKDHEKRYESASVIENENWIPLLLESFKIAQKLLSF